MAETDTGEDMTTECNWADSDIFMEENDKKEDEEAPGEVSISITEPHVKRYADFTSSHRKLITSDSASFLTLSESKTGEKVHHRRGFLESRPRGAAPPALPQRVEPN